MASARRHNLLPLAKKMRRTPTQAEARLWSVLRAGRMGGVKFKRQQPIGDDIVDFVCFAEKLIIEADGSQHVDNPVDERRTAWLEAQGFRVARFWNNDILADTDVVALAIHALLDGSSPSPLVGEGLGRGEI